MRRSALLLALAALIAPPAAAASRPAPAQAPPAKAPPAKAAPAPSAADARNPATLIAVLEGLGAKATLAKGAPTGKVQYDLQTPGGGFGLQFVECDAKGLTCRAAIFSAGYDRKGATLTQVNEFNRRSAVCRGYLGDDFKPNLVYSTLLSPRLASEDLKEHVGAWQGCLSDFGAFTADPTAYLLGSDR